MREEEGSCDACGRKKVPNYRHEVYLSVNPQSSLWERFISKYFEAFDQNPQSVFVITCDDGVPDMMKKDGSLKQGMLDTMAYYNLPYHSIRMEGPTVKDYTNAIGSLYVPCVEDCKEFGGAGAVIGSLGKCAFSMNLGVGLLPIALEHAALRYSGEKNPTLMQVLDSYEDVLNGKL